MHLLYPKTEIQICVKECVLIKGFKQSLSHSVSVSLMLGCIVSCQNISTLTAQPGQSGWHQKRSVEIHWLHQFLGALLVFHHSSACRTDHISQLSIMSQKTTQKTDFFQLFYFFSLDSYELVPSTSSQPADSKLPTQEGKQTNHEYECQQKAKILLGISEKCLLPWRVPSSSIPNVVLLSIRLAHNSAVGRIVLTSFFQDTAFAVRKF